MCDLQTEYRSLLVAALDCVPQAYYKLETTYEPTGVVRERVFCYELYHRIRRLQEMNGCTRLSLNGEIDKRGHGLFRKEDRKNPDFVFHVPGTMDDNTIIVEVKGRIEGQYKREAIEDIKTLILFVERYGYKQGAFLVYNYSFQELCLHLKDALREQSLGLTSATKGNIYVIVKKAHNIPTEIQLLDDLL